MGGIPTSVETFPALIVSHATKCSWVSRAAILGLAVTIAAGVATVAITAARLPPLPLDRVADVSTVVLDREGRLLRAFTTKDGRWRLDVLPGDVDSRYLAMLLAFEDRRFHSHHGVDPLAFGRATWQLARHRRVVSGASTLTMQVARLIEGGNERSLTAKLTQIARALELEARLPKAEILNLYLKLAPMGGNIEGARAASLAYFGKEPARLTLGEAALLVALPQSPEARRPDRAPEAARLARDRVLDRAVVAGVVPAADASRAKDERVPGVRHDFLMLAPHLAQAEALREPKRRVHRLTLDRDAQAALEDLARERAKLFGQKLSTAILAVEHRTGEVVAYVGSADFMDAARHGSIDMVEAVRSPGSALKPFIYGLAFEAGLAHPEMLIVDGPTRFGGYKPRNFDEAFRGTITVREALAHSLNIPAVKMLAAVGPARLVGRLNHLGVMTALPPDTQPALAIALGGIGVRLLDLATLYASLARGGEPVSLAWRSDGAVPPRDPAGLKRLLSPLAAWYVTDILKDAPPPPGALGGHIAFKTGTSYGSRDAWAAGYDGRHTIAVWIGRPDGAGTPGLMGRTAAAPILFDAFARLGGERAPLPPAPPGVVTANGSALPPPLKRFQRDALNAPAGPFLEPGVLIAFPPDRSEVEVEVEEAALLLKAEGGALPLTWLVDNAPVASDPHRREVAWTPAGRGFFKLSVIDANGRADRVTVRLK